MIFKNKALPFEQGFAANTDSSHSLLLPVPEWPWLWAPSLKGFSAALSFLIGFAATVSCPGPQSLLLGPFQKVPSWSFGFFGD